MSTLRYCVETTYQMEACYEPIVNKNRNTYVGAQKNIIAIVIVIVSLVVLITALTIYDGSDLKYNNEIKSAYVRVIDDLVDILPYTPDTIDGIRFYEPKDVDLPAEVQIFATRDPIGDGKQLQHHNYFYDLAYDYYQSLKTAENSGDLKKYVEILSLCFHEMELRDTVYSETRTDLTFNEEEAVKFNELFNLKEYGLDQVGFLPQFIDYEKTKDESFFHVTFSFKGLSFVETGKNAGDNFLPLNADKAVVAKSLNEKDIDIYEVDYELTFDVPSNENYFVGRTEGHIQYLKYLFSGENEIEKAIYNLKVVPTFMREVDLVDLKMQCGKFDFKQPNK